MPGEHEFRIDVSSTNEPVSHEPALSLTKLAWRSQGIFRWATQGLWILVVGTIALCGFTLLNQDSVAQARMHVPDVSAYDMSSLVGPSLRVPKPWNDALSTWKQFRAQQCQDVSEPHCADVTPRSAVVAHLAVDTILFAWPAAFFVWLLLFWFWSRGFNTPGWGDEGLHQVLALALVLPILQLVFDLFENALITLLVARYWNHVPSVLPWIITVVTLLKWLCVSLALLIWALIGVLLLRKPGSELRKDFTRTFRRVIALRAQLLAAMSIVILLALSGDLGGQITDVVIRLVEDPATATFALVMLIALTATIAITGLLSLWDHDQGSANLDPGLEWPAVTAALALSAALIVLGFFNTDYQWLLWPLGIGLLLFGLLSLPTGVRKLAKPSKPALAGDGQWPFAVLVAVPGWVFVILLSRAVAAVFFEGSPAQYERYLLRLPAFAVLAGGIAVGGAAIARRLERAHPADTTAKRGGNAWREVRGLRILAYLSAFVLAIGWGIGTGSQLWFGQTLGALAVVALFASVLCWFLVALTAIGNHVPAKGPLAVLQFRRSPVIALVVVFAIAAGTLDRDYHFHDVRLESPASAPRPITLGQAWTAWWSKIPKSGDVPMVFVATAGGGIRAAYWTSLILDCLIGAAPPSSDSAGCAKSPKIDPQRIFAASGVSGGSLGLVATFAGGSTDATTRLRKDFVSPAIARLLLFDSVNSLLRLDGPSDRAAVLERAWEEAWKPADPKDPNPLREGLFAWQNRVIGTKPILLLNGATVEDACRMEGSALDAEVPRTGRPSGATFPLDDRSCTSIATLVGSEPLTAAPEASTTTTSETQELADELSPALARTKSLYNLTCGETETKQRDVALSTSALLSARFPIVSPSGGLYDCTRLNSHKQHIRTSDVDGGGIETSGAKPLEELFARLAPLIRKTNLGRRGGCIRPRLIMLDNQYVSTARASDPTRPLESLIPLREKGLGGKSLSSAARQEAALAFDHFFAGTCPGQSALGPQNVAYLVPIEHPGVRAPLGWTLSRVSADDMDSQLATKSNASELRLIRSWFGAS